jgi:hypothetical protein
MNKKPPSVCIRHAPGVAPGSMLEEILDASGFWIEIESVRRAQKISRDNLTIAVKPDLDVFNLALPSGTDRDLVHHLASLLRQRGYASITLIDARNTRDSWLLNREPLIVADLVGYDFSGDVFEVAGGDASRSPAQIWSDADFRINFAKNRTHESLVFALCVHNLVGVCPTNVTLSDMGSRCLSLLRESPPHFNLIDGFISFHGAAGERAPVAHKSCTLIASPDALLADVVGASKMGLDPYLSPINSKCLRALGMPSLHGIDGELTPYPMWQNVHPLVAESARKRNEVPGLGGASAAWFQTVDREHFPFREFYTDRLNSFIAPLMARMGEDPRAQWLIVLINTLIASVGNGILAQHTLFAKGQLERQRKRIEIDLDRFGEDDYLNLPEHVALFEQHVRGSENRPGGFHLRWLDDAALFFAAHDYPIQYDQFVSRVSIQHAIQYMNDYIGGSLVTVAEDNQGRVRMQAERNLYLQQPNWIVLFGGDIIDVEKIQLLEYLDDRQTIYWRTVSSPNDSAQYDDGRVSFIRSSNGCMRVEIFTRQKFSLPLFFQVMRIDLFPGMRDSIVENVYRNFFERTVANMQAKFDDREFRIGFERPTDLIDDNGLGEIARYVATALATLSELFRTKSDIAGIGEWFAARSWTSGASPVPVRDSDGFRHFGPVPAGTRYDNVAGQATDLAKRLEEVLLDTPGLFAGLASAVQRDLEVFAEQNEADSR